QTQPGVRVQRLPERLSGSRLEHHVERGKASVVANILGQHIQIGPHFRLAGAVVVRENAHDVPRSMTKAYLRADRQVRVPRGELPSHHHLRGTMQRPAAADQLHVAMHLESHRPYPAEKRESYFGSWRIRGRIKARDHLGGDQGGSVGVSDNLGTAFD